MLYYVNNLTDTALKPLTPEHFVQILSSADVYRHCTLASRYAREEWLARQRTDESQRSWWEQELRRAKAMLPCILYQGAPTDEAYIGQRGSRHTSKMMSNGKNMLDIDHVSPEEIARIMQQVYTARESDGRHFLQRVGFVAVTPSGMGVRIVFNGRKGQTLVADQQWAAQLLGVTLDECCKDYTRLSFAVPMQQYVKYLALDVLFAECEPYADSSAHRPQGTGSPSVALRGVANQMPCYLYHDTGSLINQLEEELGGCPTRGSRNKFVYRMACSLRHLYGNDAESIFRAIPDYGLTDTERRHTIGSALRAAIGGYVPRCIYKLKLL